MGFGGAGMLAALLFFRGTDSDKVPSPQVASTPTEPPPPTVTAPGVPTPGPPAPSPTTPIAQPIAVVPTEVPVRSPPTRRDRTRTPKTPGPTPTPSAGTATGEGFLNINCLPYCRIYIDGVDTGRDSPAIGLKLSPGKHRLKLVNPPTQMEREVEVVIETDKTLRRVIEF